MVGVGTGALMGVARLSPGGRVGVGPPYLSLPPPLHPGLPCRARSVHGTWVERWGRGRGRSGHRWASFYPPSLGAAPKKRGARGRGVEGGVISPISKPALTPTHPHRWDRQSARKVCRFDGSGQGVGAGGQSRIIIHEPRVRGQAPNLPQTSLKNFSPKKFSDVKIFWRANFHLKFFSPEKFSDIRIFWRANFRLKKFPPKKFPT